MTAPKKQQLSTTFCNSKFQVQMLGNLKKEVELVNFLARRLNRKRSNSNTCEQPGSLALEIPKQLAGGELTVEDPSGLVGWGMRRKEMGKRRHYRCFLGDLFNLSKTFLIKIRVLQCYS